MPLHGIGDAWRNQMSPPSVTDSNSSRDDHVKPQEEKLNTKFKKVKISTIEFVREVVVRDV